MKRINSRQELQALAIELGVRLDWHEPDEQEVEAVVHGTSFDNAGFWPEPGYSGNMEQHVVLYKAEEPIAAVNLATLFAWAATPQQCRARREQAGDVWMCQLPTGHLAQHDYVLDHRDVASES